MTAAVHRAPLPPAVLDAQPENSLIKKGYYAN